MRAEFFEFAMLGKIHLSSNFLNHLGDDDATWNRMHLTPWLVTVPKDQRNKYLAKQLFAEEASGIFNRLLAGLADWRARGGLCPPDTATKAVGGLPGQGRHSGPGHRRAVDDVDIDPHRVRGDLQGPPAHSYRGLPWREYKSWAGQGAMERKTFYQKLEDRGFVRGLYKHTTMFPQLSSKYDGE